MIPEPLQPRVEALLRAIVASDPRTSEQDRLWREARAIVAELPEPVDPDLIEMREIYARHFDTDSTDRSPVHAVAIRAGRYDDAATGKMVLAALKRGRELGPRP